MKPPDFVKVLETDSLTDVALIKSVLDSAKVRYYLKGENMKFIRPVDPVLLMVAEADLTKAIELLKPLKLRFFAFDRR